jgi:hypothetical protein
LLRCWAPPRTAPVLSRLSSVEAMKWRSSKVLARPVDHLARSTRRGDGLRSKEAPATWPSGTPRQILPGQGPPAMLQALARS